MSSPKILGGKFSAGADLVCGDGVVVDVADEVRVGDRCTLAPGTYLGGRSVTLGDDFYGYDWSHAGRALDVGRGRRDDEDAVFTVGDRCTLHDNRIDLARRVTVGDDVGLSPEVVIYTHGYWQSVLDGFPNRFEPVKVGNGALVGFRATLLAGCRVGDYAVVGAGSVCTGVLAGHAVHAGNPVRKIKTVEPLPLAVRAHRFSLMMEEYVGTLVYRGVHPSLVKWDYPIVQVAARGSLNVEQRLYGGDEDEYTDDLRWFLFTRGIRVYTKRPLRKMERR